MTTQSDAKAVGERLRQALARADMTQSDLARAYGCESTTVNQWVKGRRSLSLEGAVRIAGILGIPIGYLTGELDEDHAQQAWVIGALSGMPPHLQRRYRRQLEALIRADAEEEDGPVFGRKPA